MLRYLPHRIFRGPTLCQVRPFLSDAYSLDETWNTRLSTPITKKVNLDNFYYDIDQKFIHNQRISAIDVDIFVNCMSDDRHIGESIDLLHKLRKTEEASNILDSTAHALVRTLVKYNQTEDLINILDSRLQYGIILDDYTANWVMNAFIREGNFKLAARIATIHMLQEDFSNPITRALSLVACVKHLSNFEEFDDLKVPVEEVLEPGVKKKRVKIEEVKVRVGFLRNPYFDDHFDIRNSMHLLGKTLVYIGKTLNSNLGLNVELLGLALYQKYDQAIELLEKSKGKEIYQYTVDKINANLGENEAMHNFKAKFDVIGTTHKVVDGDFEKIVENFCTSTVQEHEKTEIEGQFKIFNAWIDIRQKKLDEELERLRRVERVKETEQMMAEMQAEEQKLWFFENEEKIDLQIEDKKVYYPKRWFKNKKTPRAATTNYIPPEIVVEYKKKDRYLKDTTIRGSTRSGGEPQ